MAAAVAADTAGAAVAHVAVVAAAVGAPAPAGVAVVEAAAAVQASGLAAAWVAAVDAEAVGYGPRVLAAGSGPADSRMIVAKKRGGLRFEPASLAPDPCLNRVASREVETPSSILQTGGKV